MSRHTYAWYRIPDRIVLGLYALAASLWRDWLPGKVCARCRSFDAKRMGPPICKRDNHVVGHRSTCEHWNELRRCPYCKATDHDIDHCPERWQPKKESK